VASGNLKEAKELIEKGQDVNEIDKWGWSPLMWAVYYDYPPLVEYLLANKANPNVQSSLVYWKIPKGSTALIIAAYYGRPNLVRMLPKGGANPKLSNNRGYTAYQYAQEYGFDRVEKMLPKPPPK